jgi:hypothetical protein
MDEGIVMHQRDPLSTEHIWRFCREKGRVTVRQVHQRFRKFTTPGGVELLLGDFVRCGRGKWEYGDKSPLGGSPRCYFVAIGDAPQVDSAQPLP